MQLIVKHAIKKVPGMKSRASEGHQIDDVINKLGIFTAHVFSTIIGCTGIV